MSETTTDAWWIRPAPGGGAPGAPDGPAHDAPLAVTTRLDDGLALVHLPDAATAARAVPVPPVLPVLVVPPLRTGGRRSPGHVWLVATAAAAALVATGLGTAALTSSGEATARQAALAAPRTPVAVDPATVHAAASSTQDDDGSITYGAANTLDGDAATAWNSDGDARGARLVWTFAQPVDLRSISLLNGYQKLRKRSGKPPVDLYPLNARLHRVRVVTDAGTWIWDLADTRARQTFTQATGRTSSVRIEIVSAYPGRSYPDAAVSEASFTALPAG